MSAVMADKEQNESIQLAVPGLGERLRSARLARDLDIRKLADRIHLTVDMVTALERDDYSDMPARVFVRGYVRNYARTVDLPMDSIVAQFDALWPDEDAPVTVSPSPRLAVDSKPANRWHGVMTWLVLLVLLALFLIWWQGYLDRYIDPWGKQQAEQQQASEPATAPSQPGERLAQPELDAGTGGGSLPPMRQSPSSRAVETEAPQKVSPQTIEPASSLVAAERVEAPVPVASNSLPPMGNAGPAGTVETEGAARQAVRQPAADGQVAAETMEPVAAAAPPVAPAGKEIVVRFARDCWVDIRDSTRTFKLVGIMKKGVEKRLEGKPPYKVVLGNAEGVEILVDGKPFDLAAHTVANVARFTLTP